MIHYTASHINNNWQTLDLMICYLFLKHSFSESENASQYSTAY